MKTITGIMLGSLLLLSLKDVNSQIPAPSQELEVTYNKTVSVCFPAVITSVDRGSRDVMAQKVKGVENVLQLKAARENFPETNLTVITADGAIHQFTVNYAEEPNLLIVNTKEIDQDRKSEGRSLIFQMAMTESDFEDYATRIVSAKKTVRFISEQNYKVSISLSGVYIKDNVIFYHFQFKNKSHINYNVDFLRFYVQDKTKVKRTASQEINIEPIYSFGNTQSVKGKSSEEVVFALQKFTIPDAKRLIIEVYEKNGGRHLNLAIKNKTIVNARLVE